MAKNPEQLVKTWGEDLTDFYNNEFYKQANGNRDEFIKHNIDRFGIPRGSTRQKEMEHYGSVFDKMSKPSLRERWNRYIDEGIGSGEDVDYWNQEITDIEKQLPFKDNVEHKKWSDMGSTWMGEPEWLNLTDELLKRYERGK